MEHREPENGEHGYFELASRFEKKCIFNDSTLLFFDENQRGQVA